MASQQRDELLERAKTQIDALMISIDGNGRFSRIALITILAANFPVALVFYNLAFFELMPVFLCNVVGQTTQFVCYPENFCNDSNLEWVIDYSSPESLHNWVEPLNLVCRSHFEIALLGSTYFVGWMATLVVFSRIADLYGRKTIFIVGTICQVVSLIVILASKNYWLTVAMMCSLGALTTIR